MGRKAKITKEMVLEAAFSLLDEGGINAVIIKTIAAKLQCSTQPISWLFGSMTELRKELLIYSGKKMWGNLEEEMAGLDAVHAFFQTGIHYLTVACDHPHVFRFMNVDNPKDTIGADVTGEQSMFSMQMNPMAVEILSKEYDVSKVKISEVVQNMVIYTHGLAVMMMWDDYKMPKETAIKMVYDLGIKLLKDIGIEVKE